MFQFDLTLAVNCHGKNEHGKPAPDNKPEAWGTHACFSVHSGARHAPASYCCRSIFETMACIYL
jgi:hypothetical protein